MTKRIYILFAYCLLVAPLFSQSIISLAGNWKVALDQTDEGVLKRWYEGKLSNDIQLPGTTDLAKMGIPEQTPWVNYLTRPYKYIGAAWYQKKITIPKSWKGYNVELYLERVLWESRVWVDGKALSNPDDGLTVSHIHHLGLLNPGVHLLTIRVDNRMIHPIGDKGHNYTELTQSIWNGIVGKIELRRKGIVSTKYLRCFSDAAKKQVKIEANILNTAKSTAISTLEFLIRNADNKVVGKAIKKVELLPGVNRVSSLVKMQEAALWSEFQQPLYTAELTIKNGRQTDVCTPTTFGFRTVGTKNLRITINGSPILIRGNQDCLVYPLTGFPPMDVADWKKIFQHYKDYGFNQVRFHSACPPDAAFQAADELGIYVQVEVVWITSRNAIANIRPTSVTTGLPQGLGNGDRTIDSFVQKESHRILQQYGNHPSFCFFAFGNEMDNLNKKVVDGWIADMKRDDPRRLYAATTARSVLPHDDFQDSHFVPGTKGFIVNNAGKTNTQWSYDSIYIKSTVPVIAHELGQVPVYPYWSEIVDYTGPLKPTNLIKCREKAIANNVYSLDSDFHKASGYLQKILYKEDIESELRSVHSAGFNMLAMNDYPGQGEALAGWFDALWKNKETIKPEVFRQWNSTAVPLALFQKYLWKGQERFNATIKLAYNGQKAIKTPLTWTLYYAGDGRIIKKGKFASRQVKPGSLLSFGEVEVKLPNVKQATSFCLRVNVDEDGHYNQWKFWLFPKQVDMPQLQNVVITNRVNDAIKALDEGKKVLLMANELGSKSQKNLASFDPVFWSTAFFPGQGAQTLGAVIDSKHPALKYFPTDDVLDRQWQDLCNRGRATVLDGEARNLKAIVMPVDDFHNSKKLATIFEVKVAKGSLLVCGYDIDSDLDKRPAAKQLRKSLLEYINSNDFHPQNSISEKWLKRKFYFVQSSQKKAPKKLSNAFFYTYCGMNAAEDKQKWKNTSDLMLTNEDSVKYEVVNGTTFHHKDKYGWVAALSHPIIFRANISKTTVGGLYLRVAAADTTSNTDLKITLEGRETDFTVQKERWIRVPFFREDFGDNQLLLEINTTSKKNIFIKDLALVSE